MQSSKLDAAYLRVFVEKLSEHHEAIQKATEGQFMFSPQALVHIADNIEANGYKGEPDLVTETEEQVLTKHMRPRA